MWGLTNADDGINYNTDEVWTNLIFWVEIQCKWDLVVGQKSPTLEKGFGHEFIIYWLPLDISVQINGTIRLL